MNAAKTAVWVVIVAVLVVAGVLVYPRVREHMAMRMIAQAIADRSFDLNLNGEATSRSLPQLVTTYDAAKDVIIEERRKPGFWDAGRLNNRGPKPADRNDFQVLSGRYPRYVVEYHRQGKRVKLSVDLSKAGDSEKVTPADGQAQAIFALEGRRYHGEKLEQTIEYRPHAP